MADLEKLADMFDKEVSGGDIVGKISYIDEAKHLKMLAGKIRYKAGKETNQAKSLKLKEVAELLLRGSDTLNSI